MQTTEEEKKLLKNEGIDKLIVKINYPTEDTNIDNYKELGLQSSFIKKDEYEKT